MLQYAFPWGKEQIESIEYWPDFNTFDSHLRMDTQDMSVLHRNFLQASASLNKGLLMIRVGSSNIDQIRKHSFLVGGE